MGVELLKVPVSVAPSGNPLIFKVRAGNYTVPGHRLSAQIFIETVADSDTFHALPLMNLDPDSSGIADIDVSKILHRRMYIDIPDFENVSITRLTHSTLRYKIQFKEIYSETEVTKDTSIFTAIKSRLNYYNYPLETLDNYITQGKNYLSHSTDVINTIVGSIHYLVLLVKHPDIYNVKIAATYSDNSIINRTIGSFTTVTNNNVYSIPAGLKHRDLAIPGKVLKSYEIWVEDNNNQIVFRKIKFIVSRFHQAKRCFLFSNLLGGIDTIITESQSDSIKVERDTFTKYLPIDYQTSDKNITTIVTDYSNIFEANTGYITRKQAELCKELSISETVYLVGQRSFIAINIDKATFDIADDKEDLFSFKFKYSPAFEKDLILLSSGTSESYSDNDYSDDYE